MAEHTPTSILMVCLGNICRSPLAEGIMRDLIEQQGLSDEYTVDSCGTSGYHVGDRPHRGSIEIADSHGIDLRNQRSRQVHPRDFRAFDWIVAMDTTNRNTLRHLDDRNEAEGRIVLLLDYAQGDGPRDVPDPYYVGGFDVVYDLIHDGCRGLLSHIQAK